MRRIKGSVGQKPQASKPPARIGLRSGEARVRAGRCKELGGIAVVMSDRSQRCISCQWSWRVARGLGMTREERLGGWKGRQDMGSSPAKGRRDFVHMLL